MVFRRYAWVGVGLLCLLPSCGTRKSTSSSDPLKIEVGYDPTPPNAEERARQAAVTLSSLSPREPFVLRATDHKTTVISTVLPQSDAAAFAVLLAIGETVVPVTDLATYFEALAEAAEGSDTPLAVLLYTDGLDDGPPEETAARIEAAAKRLAASTSVRALILIGLVRETRKEWKGLPEMLSALKDRLSVQPLASMDPDAITRILEAARQKPSQIVAK